ncbi:MAG: radical SAM protein [Pseudomonadota bacterium]
MLDAADPAAAKFLDPVRCADGALRARVAPTGLRTLWINTGTLCNIACTNCYIESSPTNDRLVYITADEAAPLIDEALAAGATEVGFTGGEPFMNRDLFAMARHVLSRSADATVLILTNAMTPMARPGVRRSIRAAVEEYGARFRLRVSLDAADAAGHDAERGPGAFDKSLKGLSWLCEIGAAVSVAGRAAMNAAGADAVAAYQHLFDAHSLAIDATDPERLVLFPEMEVDADPPEISEGCWSIVGVRPGDMMCASSRMVVKRKGAAAPAILACTLIPYDDRFELGASLAEADRPVALNHPHCATFCVLGGASCSGG